MGACEPGITKIFSCNVTGSGVQTVVAPDYLGRINKRRWDLVIVDSRTTIGDIIEDIQNGRFRIERNRVLAILIGRREAIQGAEWSVVLERLDQVIRRWNNLVKVIMAGPLPRVKDFGSVIRALDLARVEIAQVCGRIPNWTFNDDLRCLWSECGVIKDYMDNVGLTSNGERQFWASFP